MRLSKPVAALLVALAVHAKAQKVRGALSVAAGAETDAVGAASHAVTVSPSVSLLVDPRLLLAAEASGTRYGSQQSSMSGGAAATARVPLNRLAALTLNTGASETQTSFGFSYTTATVLPALEMNVGRFSAFGGVRGAYATTRTSTPRPISSQPQQGLFGGAPLPSKTASTVSTMSRSAHAVLFGLNVRVPGEDGSSMVFGVRNEQGMIDTVATADRTATLSLVNGRVSIGGSVGLHSEFGDQSTFGNGTLSFGVTPVAALELGAGSYPANHLIGTAAGHFLTLGMSLRTGRASHTPMRMPAVDGVPAPAPGFTRLALHDEQATRVEVAGDFTNWNTIAAQRASNSVWFVDLRIPPGQYRYAFRVNGSAWRVPDGAAVVNDDFGGQSAWLTVSDTPNRSVR